MSSTLRPEITWSVVKNRRQSVNCQAPTQSKVKILDFKHELKLPNKNEKHIKCQKNMTEARRPIGTKLPHQVWIKSNEAHWAWHYRLQFYLWPHLSKCEWCWWVLTLGAQAGPGQWLLWPHRLPHRPPHSPILAILYFNKIYLGCFHKIGKFTPSNCCHWVTSQRGNKESSTDSKPDYNVLL